MTNTVAYQGVMGAYSQHAACLFFNASKPTTVPCETFSGVFETIGSGRVSHGCIPIENTLTGSILENYHLLREHRVTIVGEVMLRISHALLALPGTKLETIRTILSHPQALLQCRQFLTKHQRIKPQPAFDTAGSAEIISKRKDKTFAAIASPYAGQLYGLIVLKSNIQQEKHNYTRFLIVQKVKGECHGTKATIMYEVPHRPGTLLTSLQPFVDKGINIMKIESIPIIGRPWEYYFFLDVESKNNTSLKKTLEEFEKYCTWFKVLGQYEKGHMYEN